MSLKTKWEALDKTELQSILLLDHKRVKDVLSIRLSLGAAPEAAAFPAELNAGTHLLSRCPPMVMRRVENKQSAQRV